MQIDNDRIQQFARVVHHGAFHAVAVAGVESQSGQPPGGRGEQQVFEIAGEHGNRVSVGSFFQTIESFEFQRQKIFARQVRRTVSRSHLWYRLKP